MILSRARRDECALQTADGHSLCGPLAQTFQFLRQRGWTICIPSALIHPNWIKQLIMELSQRGFLHVNMDLVSNGGQLDSLTISKLLTMRKVL
jgi:hypothetical protein